jgi:hypothetical protein
MNVYTDFESGNIGAWQFTGTRQLSFQAPLDGAPLAMWFYFRLDNAESGPFEFILNNLHECLEYTHWSDVRPVMRASSDEWQRAQDEDISIDFDKGEFCFRFDIPDEPVEIAYSYPYPPTMLDELFKYLLQFSGIEVSYPGKSKAGRPIPYITMQCTSANPAPEFLWAHSREHAGEVSGGYALDGFLRAFVSSSLREKFTLHCIPIIDLDAVAEGCYGKMAPPVDHHMCWTPDTPRPEISLAMKQMQESAHVSKFRILVNFHSPSPENDCYLVPYNPTLLDTSLRNEAERLAESVKQRFPVDFPLSVDEQTYQRVSPWWDDNTEHRPEGYVLNAFGANSLTVEVAYHASCLGTPTSQEKLRRLGASVVQGLEDYYMDGSAQNVPFYASMPPIFHQSQGWILWTVPWYTRLKFSTTHAWAVADSPESRAYFGVPRLYETDQLHIEYSRGAGGGAFVKWLCYDRNRLRLLAGPPSQPLPITAGFSPLTLTARVPRETAYVRPSFLLTGAFRPFEVNLH